MRAAEVGHTSSATTSTRARVKRLAAGESYVEDVSAEQRLRRGAGHRALPAQSTDARDCAGFDVAVITVPDAAARRRARPALHRGVGAHPRPLPAPGRDRRPGVHHLPGHHRGAGRADPGGRLRASPPAPTSTSATAPSASTRATRPGPSADHAEGRLRGRRRLAEGGRRPSTTRVVDTHRAGALARRRPSWPSCWRTPSGTSTSRWSTSWRCSPTTSASTSGRRSTPRPPSRSASCGSRPGPGVGGHCLPIDPSYLSWRVQRDARPAASASSSWPTTSTTTCPTTWCAG